MTHHIAEFPFEEKRDHMTGDYWPTARDAIQDGFNLSQVWSVTETDGIFCYGPPHHFVNVLGFIATEEHHDGNTYYEEPEDG